jgi:hypothetical protein
MAVISAVWLSYQFWRLTSPAPPIWPTSPRGAVDLLQRHGEVRHWFNVPKRHTYFRIGSAVYPPATYLMLWPAIGWLTPQQARWVWLATTIPALAWLMVLLVRESGAGTRLERLFIALIPPSMYATGATIGNGQFNVHILPMLIAGMLALSRDPPGWRRDMKGGGLFVLSLVKPIMTGPFFWFILFGRRTLRPALFIVGVYPILTFAALSFKQLDGVLVLESWVWRASGGLQFGAVRGAVANQSTLLTDFGLTGYVLFFAALLGLLGMGVWVYMHRHIDPWLQLGIFGIMSRFSIYHRWYDDMLLLLPLIALYRMARQGAGEDHRDVVAGGLFAVLLLMMMAPGGLYLLPPPWNVYSTYLQTAIWMLVLAFLLRQAWHARRPAALSPETS